MAVAPRAGIFARKPHDQLIAETQTEGHQLRRAIGALDLTALGIGAMSMSRDGLVPRALGRVSDRTRTPVLLTLLFGAFIAVLAALVPLTEIAKLVNIGTLFAFVIVNIGVIVLRRTSPELERGFRVPFVPVFPLIGAALCVYLMLDLEGATWVRFGIWLALGLVIYAVYGYRNSRLRNPSG